MEGQAYLCGGSGLDAGHARGRDVKRSLSQHPSDIASIDGRFACLTSMNVELRNAIA